VASVTMVGARSLLVAQVCANDTSRGNPREPIFITDTNRVLFHDEKELTSIAILKPPPIKDVSTTMIYTSCSKIFQTGRSLFLYLP